MTEQAQAVVKKETGDDVIADIIGDGNYEQDEEMPDAAHPTNPNPNPVRIASPVSLTPLPSTDPSAPSATPSSLPPSLASAIPTSLNVEPISPPSEEREKRKETAKEREKEVGKEKAKDEDPVKIKQETSGETKAAPRIIKLCGDGHMDNGKGSAHEAGHATIKAFRNRPGARRSARFFVMKSFSENHLKISSQKGIWATQHHNESKLNDAFRKSDVVLVFSVNESRHFQGYAQMTSPIGGYKYGSNVWTDSKDGAWGNSFSVKWLQLYDLPFTETVHIRNPLNDDKPVKVSRDGQELDEETAIALCTLIDNGAAKADKKRKPYDDDDRRKPYEKPLSNSNGARHSSETKRVRGDDYSYNSTSHRDFRDFRDIREPLRDPYPPSGVHDIHNNPPFPSRRIVLPPSTRMPVYPVHDYTQPPPPLHSHGYAPPPAYSSNVARVFSDRYNPRAADASPPPKRTRSQSPPLRAYARLEMDRKRKEREDEEERERARERIRERERERDRERERERGREKRGGDRDKRGGYSPPPDLLNMSYEDYLQSLAKYRRMPQPPWGTLGGGTAPLSELEYSRYLGILTKKVQSRDISLPDYRGGPFS
eukprot:Phypoly_transcript_02026.p1 GENE.Phypoly_transcript_02026~~Phypoly_transcript_02026.p1  ORF type:complete len:596 (+),score=148.30 Phypoly_transcript_02026:118-1905(+)